MGGRSHGRILVVDDNALNRKLLAEQLAACAYDAVLCDDGAAALVRLEAEPFDLVLLDVMMPGLDGYDVLARIRKHRSSLELPVIMVTARDESADVVKALKLGANDYVTKPVDIAVAVARIETHLALRALNSSLQVSEERLSLALEGANDGLWDWDLTTGRVFFSDRWKRMLGFAPDEIGDDIDEWFDRVHPAEIDGLRTAIDSHLAGRTKSCKHEYRILNKDGRYVWVLCRGIAVFGDDGEPTRLAGSQTDVTDRKTFDPLTGLPNRVLFSDRLERVLHHSQRAPDSRFAVIILELDALPKVTASLGPVASDALLNESARRIAACFDDEALTATEWAGDVTVTRFEGAEYAVLIEDLRNIADASRMAVRAQQALARPVRIGKQDVYTKAWMGITIGGQRYDNIDAILRDAGIALGRAKSREPGSIEIYDKRMQQRALKRLNLETELRRATDNGAFGLRYQPIVDVRTGDITGFEALVRWQLDDGRQIPPATFIPMAEELGLIVAVDDWVMRNAFGFHRTLLDSGMEPVGLAVNISVRELESADLVQRVGAIIDDTGIDPEYLEIEVTESIFMHEADRTARFLKQLAERGVRFSIDDFGTGYSSLAYLRRLPVSVLKIDKSFIADVTDDENARAIVSTIISMSHELGIVAIAEGIERQAQADFIRDELCDRAQGHLFGKPVDAGQLTEQLREHTAAKAGRQNRERAAAH